MANYVKISALPLKNVLNAADMLAIVDTQFGPNNYISKRTTVGSIALFTQNVIGNILDGGRFPSVTGQITDETLCRDQLRTEAGLPLLIES